MNNNIIRFLILSLALWLSACASTAVISHTQAQPSAAVPQQMEWKARFASYAPDGSHLLVTLCKYATFRTLGNCRPWRYHLADKRWEEIVLTPYQSDWSIDSASYSPDGKTIAATMVKCLVSKEFHMECPYLNYRLLMIDAATGKHRTIASDASRFQPSFTPDGKSLVYWQLDNLQGVATGSTALPAKQAQTLYFTHNIHTMRLSDEKGSLAIKVKAQRPLAPPRVFADGVRVTVAGNGIFGEVTTDQGTYKGNWGVSQYGVYIDESFLIGNLQTGAMTSLQSPESEARRTIFDVKDSTGSIDEKIIYRERNLKIILMDLKNSTGVQITPAFQQSSPQYNHMITHTAFASDGKMIVYIFGWDLAIAPLRVNADSEIIKLPTFTLTNNPTN
jgi:WD40-like Beta Propeller Repeat